jgi:alcohol dehydrogenase
VRLLAAPFDLRTRGRVVYGPGSLARLGELATELGLSRVLLVTDRGIVRAGIAQRAREALESAGIRVAVHDAVREDPAAADVDACLASARDCAAEGFVAVGGGSSIDTAKGANFLLCGGGAIADYWGPNKARGPLKPLIAVPTTAGTGSEVQSYALIAEDATHKKMACGDPRAVPAVALLDPELTVSQPAPVTAATGVDALVHALECAVTRTRSAASLLHAHEAFRLIAGNLERVLQEPRDLEARGAMQLGACWAGLAIENSMLGAAHAAANPLSAKYGTVHGHAVGLMAAHVVRFNARDAEARQAYEELSRAAGFADRSPEALADRVAGLVRAAGLPSGLSAAGVRITDVPELARDAETQWTGKHNPRPVDARGFEELYRAAM